MKGLEQLLQILRHRVINTRKLCYPGAELACHKHHQTIECRTDCRKNQYDHKCCTMLTHQFDSFLQKTNDRIGDHCYDPRHNKRHEQPYQRRHNKDQKQYPCQCYPKINKDPTMQILLFLHTHQPPFLLFAEAERDHNANHKCDCSREYCHNRHSGKRSTHQDHHR